MTFDRVLSMLQLVALCAGFLIAFAQLRSIQITNSGNLALEVFKDERSDLVFKNNPKIIKAVINGSKILTVNGGQFSEEDLSNYLSFFDWIAAANKNKVITDDMVYDFHSDLLVNTYSNPEIRAYIDELKKEDPNYFDGLTALVEKMKSYPQGRSR